MLTLAPLGGVIFGLFTCQIWILKIEAVASSAIETSAESWDDIITGLIEDALITVPITNAILNFWF